MSHFYAEVSADRSKGKATRCGYKHITAHIRGWDTGAEVRVFVDPETGQDCVEIWRTKGSHDARGTLVCRWTQHSSTPTFYGPEYTIKEQHQ